MRNPVLLILSCLLAGLACSRPTAAHMESPTFRRAGYRTLAFDPRRDRALMREGYRPGEPGPWQGDLATQLSHLGYRWVPEAEADLWVGFQVLRPAQREGGPVRSARGSGKGGGGLGHPSSGRGRNGGGQPGAAAPSEFQGGTRRGGILLVLQLTEPRSGEVVWQGEARPAPEDEGSGPEELLRRLVDPLRVP